ncbi:hypothetical protein ASZ78_002653 [Callipepla squamata]|uniref:Katanin p60 ATPase-containing subunit A-like 2 n=1 Tax=Callipepla squamata TaxID=9009 RepID=A0A226MV23_CALSU|nr:hypothetical protein ASZ78_002653 [Callipepla squamata]
MELSCQELRAARHARQARLHHSNEVKMTSGLRSCLYPQDELRNEARRKNLLVLILHYLMEEGYIDAANALEQETKLALRGFEVCDNVDLETILTEYESYYFVKFQKYPKITRKILDSAKSSENFCFEFQERLLKPLSAFIGMNGEMRELAAVVSKRWGFASRTCLVLQDIYLHNPNVKWDDIIGLDAAKRLVKEAVVYPIRYPQLFTGILSPWKGLLLYGPPGTGKTLLAKAVATECNTTFFNISASTIVSKWRGDSEKLVRVLFELARYHAPSTIFLDELESVMSQRGTVSGELDSAMLRRLEKRILVDLPNQEARQAMIRHWLPPLSNSRGVELRTELDYSLLGQETDGYSGSDIKLVCKEAAMRPVRKVFDALENRLPGNNLATVCLDRITTADFLDVIAHTKPSAKKLSQKYTAWQRDFESV